MYVCVDHIDTGPCVTDRVDRCWLVSVVLTTKLAQLLRFLSHMWCTYLGYMYRESNLPIDFCSFAVVVSAERMTTIGIQTSGECPCLVHVS